MWRRKIRFHLRRLRQYRPPVNRRRRLVIRLGLLLMAMLIFIWILSLKIRPIIRQMAMMDAQDIVVEAVHESVAEVMRRGMVEYGDIVTLEKDEQGNITALVTDMPTINTIQAEIANLVLETLSSSKDTVIRIPLANIFESALFTGRGPDIKVKILAVTSVETEFHNLFTDAGINQTRHQILLDVTVQLTLLLPGQTQIMNCVTEVTVAETVIVGNVPNAYANVGE